METIKMTNTDIFARRAGAIILDGILLGVLFFVLMMILGAIGMSAGRRPMFALIGIGYLIAIVVTFLYFVLLEGPMGNGQTLGKKVLGIKVTTEDGKALSYGKSAIRNILRVIDMLPTLYVVGIILIFMTEKDQRLGDIVAKTIVVKA